MTKKLGPIETPAEDLNKLAKGKGPEPTEGAHMVAGDSSLPLVFGVVLADEPYSLCDDWAK